MSLVVDNLHKRFGPVTALDGVGFEVPQGSVVGLIGPNGSGKTTTMRIVLRILAADRGRVLWKGRPVEELAFRVFGYLPEERGLYARMRVRDQLRFFAHLYGLKRAEAARALAEVSQLLEMGEILGRRVEELSKGNAQKVQFAAACLHGPELLILDEPFSGLDPVNTRLFKRALGHLRERGTTILFSSHQMDHVEELCDSLVLIARGRVRLAGSVQAVRGATGRRVVRLAWDAADGAATRGWLEGWRARGVEVTERPHGVFEVSYGAAQAEVGEALAREAFQRGPLRLFERTYPSLEDVYVAVVGEEGEGGGP